MYWIRNPNPDNIAVLLQPDFLSEDGLKQLFDYVAARDLQTGGVANSADGSERISAPQVRKSQIIWVKAEEQNGRLFEEIVNKVYYVNNFHFNFRVDYFKDLQYSEYASDGHYGWHTDTVFNGEDDDKTRQRKISFTLQLNDPSEYEGGAFETFYNGENQEVELQRNTAVFFPSYLPHQVTPVTKGVRKSLVGWIYGPLFC